MKLVDGTSISADLVIQATGQIANTQFLSTLEPSSEGSLINPVNGFIRVRRTLQFQDLKYPNLFAVGDIADSGAHKAARPGVGQAVVVAKNIVSLIEGKEPQENVVVLPPAIHLTLGLVRHGTQCFTTRVVAQLTWFWYRLKMSSFGIRIPRQGRLSPHTR